MPATKSRLRFGVKCEFFQYFNRWTLLRYAVAGKKGKRTGMIPLRGVANRIGATWRERAIIRKAVSFGCVGVINAAVDYGVFFLSLDVLTGSSSAVRLAEALASACQCMDPEKWIIIPANIIAWLVAVSGSYIMNSYT